MVRQRPTRLVMGPCIAEIDRIAIREVQYQLEAILGGCGLYGRGAPGLVMGPCTVEIDRIVIREVQYQLEVNRCRNEEIIVKGNFGWVWPMWAGRPRIEVQYQFDVNRCRNKEIIVKGNFGWAWSMWAGRLKIDRIVIRDVQYQFEVNRCRNEEFNFQGSYAYSVGGDSGQDGRTDRQTAEITTISPRFSKSVGIAKDVFRNNGKPKSAHDTPSRSDV
ncbi:hypothetical protein DPMN_066223 [Dreissena polymorpha]|uniref:Uncharacterized protein n=1 Tax=Dreissena polymorpha TaxID=45954 RepID=A0A9D4BUU7_DREPO|nr:hypothetical protein DPMN_066223 [Dreissena polymorpha]